MSLARAVDAHPALRVEMQRRVRPLLALVMHQIDVQLVKSDGATAWEAEARRDLRDAWASLGDALGLDVPSAPASLVCTRQDCDIKGGKLLLCAGCSFYTFHARCAALCVVSIGTGLMAQRLAAEGLAASPAVPATALQALAFAARAASLAASSCTHVRCLGYIMYIRSVYL